MRSRNNPNGPTFVEQARRTQFVSCAIDALAELGFTGTSIAEVARRAGVSKSVVLYHFASKDALLEAVVEDVYVSAGQQLAAALARTDSVAEQLAVYVRECAAFAWSERARCHAIAEVVRSLRHPDGSLRFTPRDNSELVAFLRSLLEAGQRSGEFGRFDAHAMAVTLRATIDALPDAFDADPTLDGSTFAEHLVHIAATATGNPAGRVPRLPDAESENGATR